MVILLVHAITRGEAETGRKMLLDRRFLQSPVAGIDNDRRRVEEMVLCDPALRHGVAVIERKVTVQAVVFLSKGF